MSAIIGVSSTFQGFVSPGGGTVINEVSSDITQEFKTVKNASGVTVQVGSLPMVTTKITCKGKGIPALTLAVAGGGGIGAAQASGTIAITSVSVDESNEDYPSFSIEAIKYN